jgi:hypothetical protein
MQRLTVGLPVVAELEELEPPVEVARDDDRALVRVLVLDGVRRCGLKRSRTVAIQASAWPGSVGAAEYPSRVEERCAHEHEAHAPTRRGNHSSAPPRSGRFVPRFPP